ncbi:MAG: replicative DNA helicase [Bacteroidales bacterium]|nr:replicative DNA helicase [Bacteroidales bacterium]
MAATTQNNSKTTKRKNETQFVMHVNDQYGRIPPHDLQLEEVVLGAIMLETGAEIDVFNILSADSFYTDAHRKIYEAILHLSSAQHPIDIYTVTEQLAKEGTLEEVGGAYYIASLTEKVGSAAHLEYHSRILQQKYIQRQLIKIATEIEEKSYDVTNDVNDILEFSEKSIFDLANGNVKSQTQAMNDVIKESIAQIEEASKRTDGLSGVPSGFTSLDRITQGWQKSDMVVIAARPAMGKTAFILSMARNMTVNHKVPVLIFSLEMSAVQLVNRLIVSETELSSEKIRTGKLEDHEWIQLETKVKNLQDAPLFIDDTAAISLFELRSKCIRMKLQHNIGMVMIDYLQLMSGPPEVRGNREQEVSTISRGIKQLAKELNVPIIALSQLSRSTVSRGGDNRPQLNDLRDSGAIEQDADIVCFIHRPQYYGILQDAEGNSTEGLGQVIIAKHRNGATCDVNLHFRAEFARFEEWDSMGLTTGLAPLDDSGNMVQTFGSSMNNDAPGAGFDPFSSPNPFGGGGAPSAGDMGGIPEEAPF